MENFAPRGYQKSTGLPDRKGVSGTSFGFAAFLCSIIVNSYWHMPITIISQGGMYVNPRFLIFAFFGNAENRKEGMVGDLLP